MMTRWSPSALLNCFSPSFLPHLRWWARPRLSRLVLLLTAASLCFLLLVSAYSYSRGHLKWRQGWAWMWTDDSELQLSLLSLQATIDRLQTRLSRIEAAYYPHLEEHQSHAHPFLSTAPLLSTSPHPLPAWPSSSFFLSHPSPLTLPTPSHLSALASSPYPRRAVFTLISIDPPFYCHVAWVLFKSLRMANPSFAVDFVLMYEEGQSTDSLTTDPFCAALASFQRPSPASPTPTTPFLPFSERIGAVRFLPVPVVPAAPWHEVLHERWLYSMNRLEMFRVLDYERIVYIDADSVFVHSPLALFDLGYDLAAVVDQWDGCERRSVMNGGLLSFRPSSYLYQQLRTLFYRQPSCLSAVMRWSDQELINCLCGYAGAETKAARDLSCGLLPAWVSTAPAESACPFFSTADTLAIHYMGTPKPWEWDDEECIEWGKQRGGLKGSNGEVHRCHKGETGFLTFWHCLDDGGSVSVDHSNRTCVLHVDAVVEPSSAAAPVLVK